MRFQQLRDKLTLVFGPYLGLMLVFLAGYGLLDAALLRWAPGFEPNEELRQLWVPLLLALGLVLWGLGKRIWLLAEPIGRQDPRLYLVVVAVATMGLSAYCLHNYLVARLHRLVVLDSPAQADAAHSGQYYQFRRLHQSARYGGSELETGTSNRGRDLDYELYVVTPMRASAADTGRPVTVWRTLHYHTSVASEASPAEREAAYQAFMKRTQRQFDETDAADTSPAYYQRLPNSSERDAYGRAARRTGLCPADSTQPLLLLAPAEEPYATRGSSWRHWLLGWVLGGAAVFFGLLLLPPLEAKRVAEWWSGAGNRE